LAKARVFCIDDDTLTLEYLKDALSERYSVGTCSESNDALNRLVEFQADLVLLDLNMPDFDGTDVLNLIRTFRHTRELPVIALTGNSDSVDLGRLAHLGIRGLLEKGSTSEELIVSIDTALAKPEF
jgi:CheY-like chemotaxis protein